jgi:hypothetical protein
MMIFPIGIKLPNVMAVQRLDDADPGEHRRAVLVDDQKQRLDRILPFLDLLFSLRQFLDVSGSVLQRDELASTRQRDRIVEAPVPALGCVTRRDQCPPA